MIFCTDIEIKNKIMSSELIYRDKGDLNELGGYHGNCYRITSRFPQILLLRFLSIIAKKKQVCTLINIVITCIINSDLNAKCIYSKKNTIWLCFTKLQQKCFIINLFNKPQF